MKTNCNKWKKEKLIRFCLCVAFFHIKFAVIFYLEELLEEELDDEELEELLDEELDEDI